MLAQRNPHEAYRRVDFDARVAGSEAPLTPRLAAAFAAAGVTPDTLAAGARIARAFSLRG